MRNSKVVAIQIIHSINLEKAKDEIKDAQQEITMLSQCDSPHIVHYYGSYLEVREGHQELWNWRAWGNDATCLSLTLALLIQQRGPSSSSESACVLQVLLMLVESTASVRACNKAQSED